MECDSESVLYEFSSLNLIVLIFADAESYLSLLDYRYIVLYLLHRLVVETGLRALHDQWFLELRTGVSVVLVGNTHTNNRYH